MILLWGVKILYGGQDLYWWNIVMFVPLMIHGPVNMLIIKKLRTILINFPANTSFPGVFLTNKEEMPCLCELCNLILLIYLMPGPFFKMRVFLLEINTWYCRRPQTFELNLVPDSPLWLIKVVPHSIFALNFCLGPPEDASGSYLLLEEIMSCSGLHVFSGWIRLSLLSLRSDSYRNEGSSGALGLRGVNLRGVNTHLSPCCWIINQMVV